MSEHGGKRAYRNVAGEAVPNFHPDLPAPPSEHVEDAPERVRVCPTCGKNDPKRNIVYGWKPQLDEICPDPFHNVARSDVGGGDADKRFTLWRCGSCGAISDVGGTVSHHYDRCRDSDSHRIEVVPADVARQSQAKLSALEAERDKLREALEYLERMTSGFPLQRQSWPLIVVYWAKQIEEPLNEARQALDSVRKRSDG